MYFVFKEEIRFSSVVWSISCDIGVRISNRGYSYPFATFVMDAQSGEALYSQRQTRNCTLRLLRK